MRFLAALQGIVLLVVLAVLGIGAVIAWRYFSSRGLLGSAQDLKANTPLGIPARTIDAGISAATGREETLGGFLAEIFDPATRSVSEQYGARRVKPVGDDVIDDSPVLIMP
jgi:hypothetical protein